MLGELFNNLTIGWVRWYDRVMEFWTWVGWVFNNTKKLSKLGEWALELWTWVKWGDLWNDFKKWLS